MQKLIDTLDKHFKKKEECVSYSSNNLLTSLNDYYVNLARLKGEVVKLKNKFYEIDKIFDNYTPYVRHLEKYDFEFLLKSSSHKVDDFFLGGSGVEITEKVNGWESRVSFSDKWIIIGFSSCTNESNPKVLKYSERLDNQSVLIPIVFEDRVVCFDNPGKPFEITRDDFNDLYLLILRTIKKLKHVSDVIEDYTIDAVNEWVDVLKRENLYGYNLYDTKPNTSEI